jgi:hypothetical protein
MKKLLLSLIILIPTLGFSQNIFSEAFEYSPGSTVANSGGIWTTVSGTAATSLVTAGSLTYSGYFPGAVGAKIAISNGSSEDVVRSFSAVSGTGSKVYASFLINVTAATTSGDYFVHFSGGTFKARTSIKTNGAGFDLGIDGDGSSPIYIGGTAFNFNQNYLVVIAYSFNVGSNDDVVSLWVNPDISGVEPTANVTKTVTADFTTLTGFGIRQAAANTPTLSIDGIKVGLTWATSTLPITLTSFTGKEANKSVLLNWVTASEKNNKTFEVFRAVDGKNFKSIGTVAGAGNSNAELKYAFVDANPFGGTNYYQLKQTDFDGKSSTSETIAVDSKIADAQITVYAASSSVNIGITSPNETTGKLSLFDISGRKISERNISLNKGYNSLELNDNLNPGIHFITLENEGRLYRQKFVK